MDRRPSGLTVSKAVVGYLQYKTAEGLSTSTITTYESHLKLRVSYAGEVTLSDVTTQDLQRFSLGCAPSTNHGA